VLGAYAPDMRSGHNGGGHALSNAAIGFSGLVRLAEATGRNPLIIRDPHEFGSEDLLVATPESGTVDVSAIVQGRVVKPTLMILPKWAAAKDPDHTGWVRVRSLVDPSQPEGVLAPQFKLTINHHPSGGRPLVTTGGLPANIRFTAPRPLQVITRGDWTPEKFNGRGQTYWNGRLNPLVTDGAGGVVLGQIGDAPLYVLSDPDLLDNVGMKDANQAAAALALLDWMNSNEAKTIGFDVTLNGFGRSRSPLKLAFDPPFLAMTLAIAAAILLLGVHAFGRFGAPRRRERAIAFGKAALVDNTALLIRKAGRASRLGGRYAGVIRDQAVAAFGVSPRLKGAAIDAYLDGLGGTARFTDLAAAAEQADDNDQLLAAARALHEWQREKLG
jgi:hypothetical protein